MGQAVSNFFTTTLPEAAKTAWGTVVKGVTAFGNWLEKEVKSLVTSVINSISDIIDSIKEFFINCWESVEAFTQKIFGLKPNLKDYVWDGVYKVGKGFVSAGVEHMRERLKALNYKDIDSLNNEQVEKLWNEYMTQHPVSAEEKKELEATFGSELTGGTSKMMSGTGGYSKFQSPPATALGATSAQDSEKSKRIKDHAITHLTFVIFSPDQLKVGLPKSVSLTLHEEQELNRLLSI